MSTEFPKEIIINGKRYVHGPALPSGERKTPEKCAHCAGSKPGATCASFGYECLCSAGVYWILRPKLDLPREKLTDIPVSDRAVCPHCRKKFRKSTGVGVQVSDSETENWCPWCATEHTVECQKCGAKCAEGYGESVDGAHWCGHCVEAHTKPCDRCGMRHAADKLVTVREAGADKHWCGACARDRSVVCVHCGTRVPADTTQTVDGAPWCRECAVHASPCSSCGSLSADLQELEGAVLCPTCMERAARATVYSYHGFPNRSKPRFWKTDADVSAEGALLYLGFELEAGGATSAGSSGAASAIHKLDPTEVRFHMEHDCTIPNYGFELISAPHTLAAHAAYRWEEIVKAMASRGLKSHDLGSHCCGLHVHVSRDFLTADDCVKLDLFVLKNKTFWERVSRRSQTDMAAFTQKSRIEEFGRSGERHVALNFTNARTVEFRMFRGTLKYTTLMATLELVDGLCRWIKTRDVDGMLKNDGETDKFAAWLAGAGSRYARAAKYIMERKAVDDPDGSSESAGD